jgi:DNA polymerase IV
MFRTSAHPHIVHVDADAFFASVEQAIHPEYRGKPVITGAERGIVAAASYEAKALGIKRAIPLHEAKKICPHLIILPSDYETYSLYSKKIFIILRRYSPQIEEYSIDEAFVDLKGLRRVHHCSYQEIARRMQRSIHEELGITVSVGLSLSKSLAKLGSKRKKPHGFVAIPGRDIERFLSETPLREVWGFGPNISALLEKHGLRTALDYIRLPISFIKNNLGKVGIEIYQELSGERVYHVSTQIKQSYASISKFKTFTPPSKNPAIVYARLLRNLESACIKARRYQLSARHLVCILRQQDFRSRGLALTLSRPSAYPLELQKIVREIFGKLFQENVLYRATGIILAQLEAERPGQFEIFENPLTILRNERLYQSLDEINARYGKHTVFLGDGVPLGDAHSGRRGEAPQRKKTTLLKGENKRQRVGLPMWHARV